MSATGAGGEVVVVVEEVVLVVVVELDEVLDDLGGAVTGDACSDAGREGVARSGDDGVVEAVGPAVPWGEVDASSAGAGSRRVIHTPPAPRAAAKTTRNRRRPIESTPVP